MKKTLALLLALIMMVSVIPFAAAADHEHYDANGNGVCDAPGCTEPVHAHYDNNGNGVCDAPGCTEPVAPAAPEQPEEPDTHTHNDANGNGVCDYPGCTQAMPTDPVGPGAPERPEKPGKPGGPITEGKHVYTYKYTNNRHWLECYCGEVKAGSYADHRLNSRGECSVCGYKKYNYGYDDCYGSYRVYLTDSGKGDTRLSTRYADKGDTVYIYTDPDFGYAVISIEVTANSRYNYNCNYGYGYNYGYSRYEKEISLSKRGTNTYSFRMPASDVTVKVAYSNSKYDNYNNDYVYGSYTDVSSDAWYYSAVKYVTDREIMAGASYTKFAPNANMTRATLAEAIYAIAGSPAAGTEKFSDVDPYDSFCAAAAWCSNKGIVEGWNNKFMPYGEITREELAVMLYRFAEYKRMDTSDAADLDDFKDAAKVSSWAEEAMEWAVAVGILNGTDKGNLNPQGTCTRAEGAAMIMRFCKLG